MVVNTAPTNKTTSKSAFFTGKTAGCLHNQQLTILTITKLTVA